MERLTERGFDYKDNEALRKLQQYENMEEDRQLVVLPCKVGDPYFTIERFCNENGELPEFTPHHLSDCERCDCNVPCNRYLDIEEHRFKSTRHILDLEAYIGKFIFLTREEAEAALAEKGENNAK